MAEGNRLGGFHFSSSRVNHEDDMGKGAQVALILLSLLWPSSNTELGPPPLKGIRSQNSNGNPVPAVGLGVIFSPLECQ